MVLDDELVGSDADVEGVDFGPSRPLHLPLFGSAEVSQDLEAGTPPLELHLPVQHHGSRHHDQMRTPDALSSEGERVIEFTYTFFL